MLYVSGDLIRFRHIWCVCTCTVYLKYCIISLFPYEWFFCHWIIVKMEECAKIRKQLNLMSCIDYTAFFV
uniref:Uncharacterized protein n=1 Tax=Anguilla anguilla TaxID=7936 RepID=A0A0E9WU61_ANGAN